MKKVILSVLMMLFVFSSFAQKNENRTAEMDTKALVEKYQLSEVQEAKVLKIQNRKFNNRTQIASLEQTDIEKYLMKMSSNEKQTKFSVKRILNDEQRTQFRNDERELRKKRATLSHKMQKEGATSIEIRRALLELE